MAEGFSANDKKIKNLSLLISNDGFSFAIFDQQANLLAVRSYRNTENLEDSAAVHADCLESINKDPLLKSIFKKVTVGIDESQHALVPDKLFDGRYPEKYLEVEHELVENQLIWVDKVPVLDGRNIHYIEEAFQQQLANYFPGAIFRHRTTSLIELFGKKCGNTPGVRLYAHVDVRKVFVFYYLDGKLQHTNEFEFLSPNDFLYFMMLNYQENSLDPEKIPLHLSGLLDSKSQIYDKLYRYIKKLDWTVEKENIGLGNYGTYYPEHYDLELFALELCE